MWSRALLKSDPEGADLTCRKFFLTHNMKRGIGDIYNIRVMSVIVVLEQQYRKVSDWTWKFFFVSGNRWESIVRQIGRTEFPIRAS